MENARRLMADIHYGRHCGWFERVETGIYGLSGQGLAATRDYCEAMQALNN